jgi:dihydroorotase-like cyclic amidohydrolase
VDLVVKNALLVFPWATSRGGIAVENGRIVSVSSEANLPNADRVVDAGGKPVIPGAIDIHIHAAWPDWPFLEEVKSASIAAVCGGDNHPHRKGYRASSIACKSLPRPHQGN